LKSIAFFWPGTLKKVLAQTEQKWEQHTAKKKGPIIGEY
jgi:hypothetical protein